MTKATTLSRAESTEMMNAISLLLLAFVLGACGASKQAENTTPNATPVEEPDKSAGEPLDADEATEADEMSAEGDEIVADDDAESPPDDDETEDELEGDSDDEDDDSNDSDD
jgi:hypothetical protein